MTNYTVISAGHLQTLITQVNTCLYDGYQLQGGPFTSGTLSTMFHQAIVKIPVVKEKEVEVRHRSKN